MRTQQAANGKTAYKKQNKAQKKTAHFKARAISEEKKYRYIKKKIWIFIHSTEK